MADKALFTTNYSFQKLGVSQLLEVADYNAMLVILDKQLPADPGAAADFTAGAGVAVSTPIRHGTKMLRLTLTAAAIAVTNANKYGSLQILTWKNTNLVVRSARFNLTVTKDGTGITLADTPHIAVGSAAASNTTLATTMVDTVEQVTMAGAAVTELAQKEGPHTNGDRFIAAGATNKLYLNAGTTGNTGAVDGSLTVSGTVDIFFEDFGIYS